MIGFKIDAAKSLFFDAPAVIAATTKAERRVLSKFGAFVRTRARSSIRKRKSPSPVGQPPSSHTGLLKRFLFFAFEPARHSVVIGPARLNQVIGQAPAALEYGGPSVVVAGPRSQRRTRKISVAARPYMGPAFAAELPRVSEMWREVLR